MKREEILEMKAGRELDIMIAEEVIGHTVINDEIFGDLERFVDRDDNFVYGPVRSYSEDISDARIVVNIMMERGVGEAQFWKDDSRPDVICRAALLAVLKTRRKEVREERRSKLRIVK